MTGILSIEFIPAEDGQTGKILLENTKYEYLNIKKMRITKKRNSKGLKSQR